MACISTGSIYAQTSYPQPHIGIQSKIEATVDVTGNLYQPLDSYLEIPPWVLAGGWRTYFCTTYYSTMISDPEPLTNNPSGTSSSITFDANSFGPTIPSTALNWWMGTDYDDNTISQTNYQWRKNYQGVFSAHRYNHPTQNSIIISYTHGENKNERKGSKFYQNTILPYRLVDQNDPNTFAGYDSNGVYSDDWQSYFGFVNLSWLPNNLSTDWGHEYFWDQGPIAWPSAGYVTSRDIQGVRTSNGLRHPSSIISGAYVYIYYWDTSIGNEEGRKSGVKVVRALLSEAEQANKYEIYYNGNWQPSLPSGFNPTNMLDFVDDQGPKSTNILANTETIRFSVAKVSGDNYFIGVEEYIENGRNKVALRTSYNLLDWSDRQIVVSDAPTWSDGILHYPIFLNANGWTNTEVDIDNFFIIGSWTHSKIRRIKYDLNVAKGSTKGDTRGAKMGVFPNPLKNSLQINFSTQVEIYDEITICDFNGREVLKLAQNGGNIYDISSLEKGMFFVKAHTDKGLLIERIIKE